MDPSSAATANTDRDLRSCNGGAARGTLVIFIKVCLYDGPFMWSSCHLHCFFGYLLVFSLGADSSRRMTRATGRRDSR